jgi:predicted flap endonuclease-1-like 5' DNA nuclease
MLKKEYLKSKPVCKVTFSLPVDAVGKDAEVRVLGEFNNWSWEAAPVMKAKKAAYEAVISLDAGKHYQFRYCTASGEWHNDHAADAYIPSEFDGIDNSVVAVEEVIPAASKKKATAKKAAPKKATAKKPAAKKAAPKKAAPKKAAATKDSLKKIEGIGPKIEQLLNAAGIETFAALAKAKPAKIKEILLEAGSRYKMHDPTTWPQQAKLAAAGKWDQLATLQEELKGGKRK